MTDKCLECKWSQPDGGNGGKEGICRFNPPVPVSMITPQGPALMTAWPKVSLTRDYCSHFERQMVKIVSAVPKGKPGDN